MKNVIKSIAAIAVMAMMTSCNCNKTANFYEDNAEWTIESIDAVSAATNINTPYVVFSDGKINGQTGCNSFFADMKLDEDGKVSFSNLGSTKMFCPEAMEQEDAIFKAISNAASIELNDNKDLLTLKDADGNAIMTLKVKASDDTKE